VKYYAHLRLLELLGRVANANIAPSTVIDLGHLKTSKAAFALC
jgi:hypothetical protein